MDNEELINGLESMKKLSVKAKLIIDTFSVHEFISEKESCASKRSVRIARRSVDRDFRKGLQMINKNIPVYVELPKYERKGDGYVEKSETSTVHGAEEIIVNDLLSSPAKAEYIEHNPQKSIE